MERRKRYRYPLSLGLQWCHVTCTNKSLWKQKTQFKPGCTVDLSSDGVQIVTDGPKPEISKTVEMRINWPAARNLILYLHGRVIRHTSSGFAVAITDHAIQTVVQHRRSHAV
jgi:hypothetical protein